MKKMSLILLSTVAAVILTGCNGELEQLERTDNISRSLETTSTSTTNTDYQAPVGANITQSTTTSINTNIDNSIPGGNDNVTPNTPPPADNNIPGGGNIDINNSIPGGNDNATPNTPPPADNNIPGGGNIDINNSIPGGNDNVTPNTPPPADNNIPGGGNIDINNSIPGGNIDINNSIPGGNVDINNSIPGGNVDINNSIPGGNIDINNSIPGGNVDINNSIPGGNIDINNSIPDNNPQISVQSASELATTSAVDYAQNSSGVITASTLSLWLENWENNKPSSVTGRLIILQAGYATNSCNHKYLSSEDSNVLVYDVDVSNASELINSDKMDQFINQYAIDPQKDYVLLAVGRGLCKLKEVTQTWWALKYNGFALDRLGILNGTVACNFTSNNGLNTHLGKEASIPTPTDSYHMNSLNVNRSALHINETDMNSVIQDSESFIVDVRCESNKIEGARRISYKDVLTTSCNSFKFKSPEELKTLFISKGYENGKTVYIHSKAGYRSTIVALTTSAILGYPTRIFDGDINNSHCNCQ